MHSAKRVLLFIVHTARYVHIFHTKKDIFSRILFSAKKENCTRKDAFKQANNEITYKTFDY